MTQAEIKTRTRRRGLRDIHIGTVAKNTDTEYTVENITKLARALSAKVSDKFVIEKIYSDDGVEEIAQSYEGSEIDININALAPQDKQMVLGHLYDNGYLVKSDSDQAPEIAIGWRAKKGNGKYEFVWYYCGKFAEGMEDNYETQEDKLKTQTAGLKGTFYARAKEDTINGKKKKLYAINVDEEQLLDSHTSAKEAIINWFKEVQEYKPAEG